MDRQQAEFLRTVREKPGAEEKLKRSWFGRLMLRTAERADESWRPEVQSGETVLLTTRCERVTILNSITAGRLVLTDKRLIFKPVMEFGWIPWAIRTSEMAVPAIVATSGTFLSRGIHLKPFWFGVGYLPGLVHTANLKVRQGRRAPWLRVEKPNDWQRAIAAAAAGSLCLSGGNPF
jgi:hypothetical protein